MKTRRKPLFLGFMVGIILLGFFGMLLIRDLEIAKHYSNIHEVYKFTGFPMVGVCTLIGCSSGLQLGFHGNLQQRITVKFTSPDGQSSFIVHCGGFPDSSNLKLLLIPFGHSELNTITQSLPPDSTCEPGSQGSAAAFVNQDNELLRLAISCTDQSAEDILHHFSCIPNPEYEIQEISFHDEIDPYSPSEVNLTVYLPDETITTMVVPNYEEVYMNGKDCGITCIPGWVNIDLPFTQVTPTVEVP